MHSVILLTTVHLNPQNFKYVCTEFKMNIFHSTFIGLLNRLITCRLVFKTIQITSYEMKYLVRLVIQELGVGDGARVIC
jgi:hypothetical protein